MAFSICRFRILFSFIKHSLVIGVCVCAKETKVSLTWIINRVTLMNILARFLISYPVQL